MLQSMLVLSSLKIYSLSDLWPEPLPRLKLTLKVWRKESPVPLRAGESFQPFSVLKLSWKCKQPSCLPAKRLITCQFIRSHLLEVTRCQLVTGTGSRNRSLTIDKHCCFCCKKFSPWACGLGKGQTGKVNHRGMTDGHTGSEQNYEIRWERGVWSWRNAAYWADEKPWGSHWSKYEQCIVAFAPSLSSLAPITKHCNSANFPSLSTTALKG